MYPGIILVVTSVPNKTLKTVADGDAEYFQDAELRKIWPTVMWCVH